MYVDMGTSWIELLNNHHAYLTSAGKVIELAKENLVEGRTQCPCSKCKVDKWFLIDEVEQHLYGKGFHKQYMVVGIFLNM